MIFSSSTFLFLFLPIVCALYLLVRRELKEYHDDVTDQIEHRTVDFEKETYGVKQFIVGFAKKVRIANTLKAVAEDV